MTASAAGIPRPARVATAWAEDLSILVRSPRRFRAPHPTAPSPRPIVLN